MLMLSSRRKKVICLKAYLKRDRAQAQITHRPRLNVRSWMIKKMCYSSSSIMNTLPKAPQICKDPKVL